MRWRPKPSFLAPTTQPESERRTRPRLGSKAPATTSCWLPCCSCSEYWASGNLRPQSPLSSTAAPIAGLLCRQGQAMTHPDCSPKIRPFQISSPCSRPVHRRLAGRPANQMVTAPLRKRSEEHTSELQSHLNLV